MSESPRLVRFLVGVQRRPGTTMIAVNFFLLTAGAGLALALPAGIIWILDVLQVVSLRAVLEVTLSWQFLLGSTLVGIAAWLFTRGP